MTADLIREARLEAAGLQEHGHLAPARFFEQLADALERAEQDAAQRHPPRHPREGWDREWIRHKTQAAITHLRDLEDWAILRFAGRGEDETDEEYAVRLECAPAMILARRARECYEHISEDIKNGKTTAPSMRERLERAEERARVAETDLHVNYPEWQTERDRLTVALEWAEKERDEALRISQPIQREKLLALRDAASDEIEEENDRLRAESEQLRQLVTSVSTRSDELHAQNQLLRQVVQLAQEKRHWEHEEYRPTTEQERRHARKQRINAHGRLNDALIADAREEEPS